MFTRGRRLADRRTEAQLRSDDRVARHARNIVWTRAFAFVTRFWPGIVVLLLLPLAALAPLAVWLTGNERFFVLGAAAVSGLWLAILVAVVASGISPTIMGLIGETWTASDLRSMRRRGWRLINGMRLRGDSDIDHIVIGPAGVFVLETKWSGEAWPEPTAAGFLGDRITRAAVQVAHNASNVSAQFAKPLAKATIEAVLVLWSSVESDAPVASVETNYGQVTVIPGADFRLWLLSQRSEVISDEQIESIFQGMTAHVESREQKDLERLGPDRPRLSTIAWHAGQYFLGAVASVYLLGFLRLSKDWRVIIGALVISTCLGYVASRQNHLRRFSLGWAVASGLLLFVTGVVALVATLY
jgi:hypothetical protein